MKRADDRVFKVVTGGHTPRRDAVLLPLTRLADRSLLWMLLGLGVAVAGGRFGRRAALRSLVAVAATSLLANQPFKRIARRNRPQLLPRPRRLVRRPASYSFPSGHAASAAAFSTAVSLEMPQLSVPLGALAFSVGYSRIYSGVHYPSDVVVGAGLGAAVALGTLRFWPLAPHTPAAAVPVVDPAVAPSSVSGKGLTIVVNRPAGRAVLGRGDPAQELRAALPEARIVEVDGPGVASALEEASSETLAVGVAGGDGSANAAAAAALETGKPLFLVPAGTLNHLARDLGIRNSGDALAALKQGTAGEIEVGTAAGKPFLNTASLGSYADLVEMREKLEPSVGKWTAMVLALFKVLRRSEPVEVRLDGRPRKLWMLFAGNCCYRPSGFAPTWRERLDDGKIDVRLVDASPPWGRTRLIGAMLTGTLAKTRVYEEFVAQSLEVEFLTGDPRLALDGEVFHSPRHLRIEKSPRRLTIYRPPESRRA